MCIGLASSALREEAWRRFCSLTTEEQEKQDPGRSRVLGALVPSPRGGTSLRHQGERCLRRGARGAVGTSAGIGYIPVMAESALGSQVPYKRPPLAWVVHGPVQVDAPVDWSRWYVSDEDDMGESVEQLGTNRLLQDVGENLARERGWKVFIGSDQFFQWVEDHPQVQISPDFYVLDDPPDATRPFPKSWRTWLPGVRPPRFAVEVVSDDPQKDHEDAPARYSSLGTSELAIFDPKGERRRPKRGVITLYRRSPEGAFVETYAGAGPAWSKELDCWLVVTGHGEKRRLRLARDAKGKDLVPTTEELRAAADQRANTEAQRANTEMQRANSEAHGREAAERRADIEARAREQAERQVAELKAMLAPKGRGKKKRT